MELKIKDAGMSDIKNHIEALNTVIRAGHSEANSWDEQRRKYNGVLVGERIIVVDKYDRTFRQGDGQYELKRSGENLIGVSHMTKESAEKVIKSLSESKADAGPYRAVDFQTYADERGREARSVANVATRAKQLMIAPYMNEAAFKMWTDQVNYFWHEDRESGQEPEKPSEYYVHAKAVVAAAPFEMKPSGEIVPKAGVTVTYGPPLQPVCEEALAVFRSKHGDDWTEKLSEQWQRSAYPGMNADHSAALQQLRNHYGPEWLSQVNEPPVVESTVEASAGYIVVEIASTANAAFVDSGRNNEVGRIVNEAALIASEFPDDLVTGKVNVSLHDINGNSVGVIKHVPEAPQNQPEAGGVRLIIELGNDAFNGDGSAEVCRILSEAAAKLIDGHRDFPLHDINGHSVGSTQWVAEPSRVNDGKVDLSAEISARNVYKADDGFSGIAEDEYRYVVADFEVGYGLGEGPVYLVNAVGEVASGYEVAQTVSEHQFSALSRDELAALSAVVLGEVSLEEHERQHSGDEPELG